MSTKTSKDCGFCCIQGKRRNILTLKELFNANPVITKHINNMLQKDINFNVEEYMCRACWHRVRRSSGVLGVPENTRQNPLLCDIMRLLTLEPEHKPIKRFDRKGNPVCRPCELCPMVNGYQRLVKTYCVMCPESPSLCLTCFEMYHTDGRDYY